MAKNLAREDKPEMAADLIQSHIAATVERGRQLQRPEHNGPKRNPRRGLGPSLRRRHS